MSFMDSQTAGPIALKISGQIYILSLKILKT